MEKVTILNISKLAMLIFGLYLIGLPVQAQLNMFEPCTGNGPAIGNDIKLGGDAAFNGGYLRLNNHETNRRGSMYINQAFPSQMGVVVEFEYWSYGNPSGIYGHGDGTSVFLFDGSVGPHNFALGAYGAGLGYSEVSNITQQGLYGGFVAVGLDEYGNWKGKHNQYDLKAPFPLDPAGSGCIGIRGSTLNHTPWLAGVLTDTLPFSLDYHVRTTIRPPESQYYRKVRVALHPSASGNLFDVTVFMQTSVGGPMQLIVGPVATDRAPFDSLKVGLAASTGGAYGYHEIRNLKVTTPGEIRVETTGTTEVVSGNLATYTATVYNESPSLLNGVSFMNILPTGFIPDGAPVFNGGTGNVTILPGVNGYTASVYQAEINMPGYSSCTFTFTGRFDTNIPGDRNVTNTAMAFPPFVYTDTDLANNTDAVAVSVLDRTPEFSVNTTYYEDINGQTTCGITQFEFVADTWLTPVSNDFPKWYINNIEEISERGKSNWNKSLPTGSHTIRMELTDDNNQTHNISTTFIVKHHTATDANMETQNAFLCSGETIDLNTLVTTTGEITQPVFKWYATLLDTIPLTSIVVAPNINTTYYVSVEGEDYCETDAAHREAVTITVRNTSTSSNLTGPENATIARGSSITLTATSNGIDAPVYQWYNTAGTLIHEGETYTVTLANTVTYYVSVQGANHCETAPVHRRAVTITVATGGPGFENIPPDEKEVTITVTPKSTENQISIYSNDLIDCSGEAVTLRVYADNAIQNPVFRWYESANAAIPFHTGSSYTTPVLTTMTTYYVSVSGDSHCETDTVDRKAITVTVKNTATPLNLTGPEDVTIARGTSITLTGTSNGIKAPVYRWYNAAGTLVHEGKTYTTMTLTNTVTYYVSVQGTNHCETALADRRAVTITVIDDGPGYEDVPSDEKEVAIKVNVCYTTVEVCSKTKISFEADIQAEHLLTTYQWQINGENIDGATEWIFTCIPNDNDTITCLLFYDDLCIDSGAVRSNSIIVNLIHCGVTVRGTVFPFVYYGEPEVDNLFPIVASLYDTALISQGALAILNTDPIHRDTVVYYDGTEFIPRTPKYPGYIGKLNNPGFPPINWAEMGYPAGKMDTTFLMPYEKPQTAIGWYKIEEVKPGTYILALSREGYVTRFAKIEVEDVDLILGHRELILGDMNGDLKVDEEDIDIIITKISQYGNPSYHPRYDVNGDLKVNVSDISLVNFYLHFFFELYPDTKECFRNK